MYRVLCDGKTLHDVRDEDYMLLSPKVSLELNKTGNFDFSILPRHPNINDINKLKSRIEVYEDNELLFAGRSLTDEIDFQRTGQIACEGELAFLLDSVQRKNIFRTNKFQPISSNIDIFKSIIAEHNQQVEDRKKFTIGTIDIDRVDEINNFDANYETTWDLINTNFIDKYQGYLRVRYKNGIRYLDYVKQYGKVNNQVIRFGENLLDLKKYTKAENIKTAIIPMGGGNVTIKNATGHNGTDYIYNQSAVDLYGWIFEKVDFPDASDPNTLLQKAQEYLKSCINLAITIELTAVDLHMIDVDINAIRLGDLVPCVSQQHGLLSMMGDISTYYLVSKYEIDLENPANNKITLGRTISSLTDKVAGNSNLTNIVQGMAGSVNDAVNTANNAANTATQVQAQMDAVTNKIYPVGSIYISVNNTNPGSFFGGSWTAFATGRTIVGVDTSQGEFNTVEKPGGHKALQSHSHTFTGNRTSTEGGGVHGHGFSLTAGSKTLTGTAKAFFTSGQSNYSSGILSGKKTSNRQYKTDGTTTNMWAELTVNATHSHGVSGSISNSSSHTHPFTPSGSIGSSGSGNAQNLQPYITVYMWKRIG